MADDFRPLNRETPMLLPPSIQEWLPEPHMARFVVELVEQLVLRLCHGSVFEPQAGASDV